MSQGPCNMKDNRLQDYLAGAAYAHEWLARTGWEFDASTFGQTGGEVACALAVADGHKLLPSAQPGFFHALGMEVPHV